MPDWTNYHFGYEATPTNFVDTRTSTSSDCYPTVTQLQQQFEEYQREWKLQDQIYEQQMQMHQQQMEQQFEEEKQLIKDKENYPLFFLKEGIV